MGANEKLKARYRVVERQRKKSEDVARRDLANAADAESIRATLHRVGAVDAWERKRLDQAAQNICADAVRRRAGHFRGLHALVEQMRGRGLTVAQVADLVGVDRREIKLSYVGPGRGTKGRGERSLRVQRIRGLRMSNPKALRSPLIRFPTVLNAMRGTARLTIRLGVCAAMR